MTILDLQIAVSSGDARYSAASNTTLTDAPILLLSGAHSAGFHWPNVTVPPGATINAAYLQVYIGSRDDLSTNIYGQASDNALTFSTTPLTNLPDRPLTTAKATAGPTNNIGTYAWYTIDVTAPVAEVLGRSGWLSGYGLALIWDQLSSAYDIDIWSTDNGSAYGAKLQIDYTSAASPVSIPLSPAALALTGQSFTPAVGSSPITVFLNSATLALVGQSIIPSAGALPGVEIGLNPATLDLVGMAFTPQITGPGILIGESDPATLSVTTVNAITGAGTHTHTIDASNNPSGESLLKSDAGGNLGLGGGLTLGGDLAVNGGDITASGNMALSPGGTIALNANIASSLLPAYTDTYDLGSSTKLWRTGWLSEMYAVLFIENTITAIGGYFIVPHGQGTLADDVDGTQTQIDFGISMSVNDFVIMRGLDGSSPKVEYFKILSLASGTTYNVTRNVDGSGANTWPQGHVFIILGNLGDGRIEFDAQSAGPQMRVLEQGAAYNAQTERVRIGQLDGWKSGVAGYGIGIGDPAGDHLYYSPTDGLTIVADGGNLTNIDGGEIQTGTVTATQLSATAIDAMTITGATIRTAASGARIEMNSSHIFGTDGTTTQWEAVAATGKLTAGNGIVALDENGITIQAAADYADIRSYKFATSTDYVLGSLRARRPTTGTTDFIALEIPSETGRIKQLILSAGYVSVELIESTTNVINMMGANVSVEENLLLGGEIQFQNYGGRLRENGTHLEWHNGTSWVQLD